MNTVSICELSCVISPSPSSCVPSYISFADPDFTASLPTVGTNGCTKIVFSFPELVLLERERIVLFHDVVIENTVIIMPCLLYECLTLRSENIWNYEG